MPNTLLSTVVMNSQQPHRTACWICVASFCARALGQPVAPLNELVLRHVKSDPTKKNMSGSGNPAELITEWQVGIERRITWTKLKAEDRFSMDQIRAIASTIIAGNPVICELRSSNGMLQNLGWKHAVALCGANFVTEDDILFKFKDPSKPDPQANQPRTVTGKSLFGAGFIYQDQVTVNGVILKNVQAYSKNVFLLSID